MLRANRANLLSFSVEFKQSTSRFAISLALAMASMAASPAWIAGVAHAACSPAAAHNVIAICDGQTINQGADAPGSIVGTDGYGTGVEDGVSITVGESATVTGSTNGITTRTNLRVLNAGHIQGNGSAGVRSTQNLELLENNGTIQGWTNGVASALDIGSVVNTGHIVAGIGGLGGAAVISSSGSIGTLTNAGTMTGATDGVFANQSIGMLTNSGFITSDGVGVRANSGAIATLFNSGTISGGSDVGVRAALTIDQLENSGVIEGATNGVTGTSGVVWLSNSGRITGAAGGGVTSANGSIDALYNSGHISGTEDGVYAEDNIVALTNSGFIGSDQIGIRAFTGQIGSIVNSGTISGGTDDGIIASTHIGSIINSGTIQGGTFAIREEGAGDTSLTLNTGSVLIGRVDLGGGVNMLNIGEGLSLNSTFESDGGATLVGLGGTGGHLVALVPVAGGGTNNDVLVVAVDPSAFTSFDDALAALTSGLGGAVQSRQAAVRSDPALGFSSGFASRFASVEETSLAAFSELELDDAPHLNPNRFWVEGFGAYRQGENDRVGSAFDSLSAGLVAGVDIPLDAVTSAGVMAGFAAITSENGINTQTTDATSFYAGIYASTQAMGVAWDASLTAGYTSYDAERITANNAVIGGLETARADFGGWFINPQITMTREADNPLSGSGIGSLMATETLEQILTLRYAGLFLDGYTETGTTNPLTLNDRSVHIASARAALALPFERIEADGAITTLRLIGGVEARTHFGDDTVSGALLGQAVSTSLDDDAFTGGGFLGLAGEYETTTGLTAYANVEAMLETDMAYQLSANLGLRIAF